MERQISRNPEIDIIRAIGIICVLIGHSNILPQGANGSGEWFIALFHVTVFYFAAGRVFKDRHCESIKELVKYILRRIRQLWIPYELFNLACLFFLEHNFSKAKIIDVLLMLDGAKTCASWFVAAMFYLSIAYAVVEYVLKKMFTNTIIPQTIISIVLLWGGFIHPGLHSRLLQVMYGYIMFHIGVIIQKSKFEIKSSGVLVALIASTAAVLYMCCRYKTLSVSGNKIVSPGYYLFVSIVGYIFVSSIAKMISRYAFEPIKRALTEIGQSTMFILLMHKEMWSHGLNPIVSKLTGLPNKGVYSISRIWPWGLIYIGLGLLIPTVVYKKVYVPIEKKIMHCFSGKREQSSGA